MKNLLEVSKASIYVGTYAKYNNGSIFGEWLNLSNYSSLDEFYEACAELHKDEADPEFMFQDYEYIPEGLISESSLDSQIFEFIEIAQKLEGYTDSEWVGLHNEFCSILCRSDDGIYSFDDDFFNTFFEGCPAEAARAASFGAINWSDDYITFNGYGNLESISNPMVYIEQEEIITDILENPSNYSI